jgi:hypothetical protein
MAHDPTAAAAPEAGWRIRVGGAVFALSIVGPIVLLPLMAAASLEAATTAAISGAILGSAELLGLGAVAIMGKPGYAYLKSRLFGLFKRYAAPAAVGECATGSVSSCFPVPCCGAGSLPTRTTSSLASARVSPSPSSATWCGS